MGVAAATGAALRISKDHGKAEMSLTRLREKVGEFLFPAKGRNGRPGLPHAIAADPEVVTALSDPELERRGHIISHAFGGAALAVSCQIVPDLHATERDVHLADRLLRAYVRSTAEEAARNFRPVEDVWSGVRGLQDSFLDILVQGDPVRLAGYLCNMCRHDATLGTVQGHLEYQKISADPDYRRFLALMFKDKLVALAEAVGATPCENPEQGPWGQNLHRDGAALVAEIERVMALDVTPPPIDGGLLKIRAGQALFHERDLNALYTAWTLKQLLSPGNETRVCEIGAGSGRVAYWSTRLGVRSYTILDLPHINVIQGFYLLKALPEANVVLYGESDLTAGRDQISILPYYRTDAIDIDQFDLVLNQDSFPEVSREAVLNYLRWIRGASRRYFLSINHESRPSDGQGGVQLNIPEMVAQTGGYRRMSRELYWLRKGYVAELYTIAGKEPRSPRA